NRTSFVLGCLCRSRACRGASEGGWFAAAGCVILGEAETDRQELGRKIMKAIDRDTIARGWANRGFSCDLWVDPAGQRWEDFTHATDEVVLVLEGQMEFEIEGKTIRPASGEELLIPAGARHSARNVGTTTTRWLYGYRRS